MAAVMNSSPRMAQLESIWTHQEKINIIRAVAPWWRRIGQFLRFGEAALDAIYATEGQKGDESCCRRLFQRWLEGAGVQPASWNVLLEVLDRTGFYGLRKDIVTTLSTRYRSQTGKGMAVELFSPPSLALLRLMKTPDGHKIEIMKSVTPQWRVIGDMLNFDEAGITLDKIYEEEFPKGGEEAVCRKMFQHWLEGNGRKPVSWATLLEILEDSDFHDLARHIKMALTYEFQFPAIGGAEIVAQTKVEISPGQPMTYHWERHGIEVHIPAGAVPADGASVTISIQASLRGDYHFPDDRVPVSGVYWLALHPPVKLSKKVTVGIQHCADADSALSFSTAEWVQESLPYTFNPLPGGFFTDDGIGNIDIDNFTALSIVGRKKSKYAINAYYILREPNIYDAHITVTPKVDLFVKRLSDHYDHEGAEEGPCVQTVKFEDDKISLQISQEEVSDIPQEIWKKDGWELCLLSSSSIPKESVDDYKGEFIPRFEIRLIASSRPQSLEQKIEFDGVKPSHQFIIIKREPIKQGKSPILRRKSSSSKPVISSISRLEDMNQYLQPPTQSKVPTKAVDATGEFLQPAQPREPDPPPSPTLLPPSPMLDDTRGRPTMMELIQLKLHKKISSNYFHFGIVLLNDMTGSLMDSIEIDSARDPSRIVTKIFQMWLTGKGLPVSWESLVETLKTTGHKALARDIKKMKL